MERLISMALGVVLERRELNNRWQQWSWRPVAVIPGAAPIERRKELRSGEGWVQVHAATLPLALHRKETLAYRTNLANRQPVVYVVARGADDDLAGDDLRPFLVTASPFEAQDYLDADDLVEGVPMPDGVIAWVQAFIDRHHVDEPFKKRQRQRFDPDQVGFGRRPATPGPASNRKRHGRA